MARQRIRIRLKAYDHRLLDRASFVYDALYAWSARQVAATT
jgi:ribosomal protein S10